MGVFEGFAVAIRSGGAHLLAVVAKRVSEGVRRCRVLWNAAVTVLLCVIASVSALRGLPRAGPGVRLPPRRLSLLIPSAVRIITPPLSLTPGTRLGVYDITEAIGEGGMGQVYRATDAKLKRQVAIKVLPPFARGSMPIGSRVFSAKPKCWLPSIIRTSPRSTVFGRRSGGPDRPRDGTC